MNYTEWEMTVAKTITDDPLWSMKTYRFALFLGTIAWKDVTKLLQDKRTLALADQLYRTVGSVGANIAEGYGRGSNRDQVRFYEYALGSARECRHWYELGRPVLGDTVVEHRMDLLAQITKLLLTIIPAERGHAVHEDQAPYVVPNSEFLNT